MEFLINLDHSLLNWINQTTANSLFDGFFPLWTDFHKTNIFKFALFPLICGFVFWKLRWKGAAFVFATALVVGLSDGFFGKILKPWIARLRPSEAGLDVIQRAPQFGGYSFPSNHAANMFCLFAFVGVYFPKMRIPFFIMAFLTAYSRVYCGVHYPSDVFGGALFGALWGLVAALLFQPLWKRMQT